MRSEAWIGLWGGDPRPGLLDAGEPSARWVTLTALMDRPPDDPEVVSARAAVLDDAGTREVLGRLTPWDRETGASGHNAPAYTPNLLHLLADLGVKGGDDERVERVLDGMLDHQAPDGRFLALGRFRRAEQATWGSLPCDHHAITEVLIRFGRAGDPRTKAGIEWMAAAARPVPQGYGWTCLPDRGWGFRGPGKKGDVCPQVTLEALRALARLPAGDRPGRPANGVRTVLEVWRRRGQGRPYMFGHGVRFKTLKWPLFWYDLGWVLDTVGRYPRVWSGKTAHPSDRLAASEMVACLVAYNVSPDGTVTPRSCYRGFESFSFGQKRRPSPIATAWVAAMLRRFSPIAAEAGAVDVAALAGSKGGTGTPVPPRAWSTAGEGPSGRAL